MFYKLHLARFLVGFISVFTMAARDHTREFKIHSGTLIIVGTSRGDITWSRQCFIRWSHVAVISRNEIYPLRKRGACFPLNDTMISFKSYHRFFNVETLIRDWTRSHPDATPLESVNEMTDEPTNALRQFLTNNREAPSLPSTMATGIFCVGYAGQQRTLVGVRLSPKTRYDFARDMKTKILSPGEVIGLGEKKVCEDLLLNDVPQLALFRQVPGIMRFRELRSAGRSPELTTEDLIGITQACLNATESKAGLSVDSNAHGVSPPNSYFVIPAFGEIHKVNP